MFKHNKMSQMFIVLVLFIVSESVSGWIVNNLNAIREENTKDSANENDTQLKLALIYPGTKWCGAGNVAESYDDLGSEVETDKCCREHDFCPDHIAAGETKYNLTNEAFYTRLSCDCDEKFRQCLRNASSNTANSIGTIYFNGLVTKCYREDYPVTGCIKTGGWLRRKCVEYSYDTTANKTYQWFDVNNY